MPEDRFDKLEIGSASPKSPEPAPAPGVQEAAEAFDAASGLHVTAEKERVILRLNGNIYREGDADLPDFARRIVARIREKGLSPALLDELRGEIPDVRFRPAETCRPSDGERDFWSQAGWGGGSWDRSWGGWPGDRWGRRYRYGRPMPNPAAMLAVMVALALLIVVVWWLIQLQIASTLDTLGR